MTTLYTKGTVVGKLQETFSQYFSEQTKLLWSSIFVTALANKKRLCDEMSVESATLDKPVMGMFSKATRRR